MVASQPLGSGLYSFPLSRFQNLCLPRGNRLELKIGEYPRYEMLRIIAWGLILETILGMGIYKLSSYFLLRYI